MSFKLTKKYYTGHRGPSVIESIKYFKMTKIFLIYQFSIYVTAVFSLVGPAQACQIELFAVVMGAADDRGCAHRHKGSRLRARPHAL
ncbi:hypothetical protein AXF42_Ash021748 [Apostasia shenzhenica]|uniref:Uncharacterized protein n=1 Tax=Apostasia shenzhenica TaxID=1088818 RepID=A0A2H9ZW26_9ASPA|nr:hypothetical protein AXF42_Ash021748 [Apostasia shenzhenica]